MLKTLILLLTLIPFACPAQIFVNPSKSTYRVKIYYKGKLIRDKVLAPFEQFKIEETSNDGGVIMYYKRITDVCDNGNTKGKAIINDAKGYYKTNEITKGGYVKSEFLSVSKKVYLDTWWKQFGFEVGYNYFYMTYLLPLNQCPYV